MLVLSVAMLSYVVCSTDNVGKVGGCGEVVHVDGV
jgi:hypothetical protein